MTAREALELDRRREEILTATETRRGARDARYRANVKQACTVLAAVLSALGAPRIATEAADAVEQITGPTPVTQPDDSHSR